MKKCRYCRKGQLHWTTDYSECHQTVGRLDIPYPVEQCDSCGMIAPTHDWLQKFYMLYSDALDRELRARYDVNDKSLWVNPEEFDEILKAEDRRVFLGLTHTNVQENLNLYRATVLNVKFNNEVLFLKGSVEAYIDEEYNDKGYGLALYPEYTLDPCSYSSNIHRKLCPSCFVGSLEPTSIVERCDSNVGRFHIRVKGWKCHYCGHSVPNWNKVSWQEVARQDNLVVGMKLKQLYHQHPELWMTEQETMKELGLSRKQLKEESCCIQHIFINKKPLYYRKSVNAL